MAEQKQNVELRSRWAPWKVIGAGIALAGTLIGIVVGGSTLYDRWIAKPPAAGSAPVATAKLVAQCMSLPSRASLAPLVTRLVKERDAKVNKLLDAMQQDLNQTFTPVQRSTFALWRKDVEEEEPALSYQNRWLYGGYVRCTISNVGTRAAREVKLVLMKPLGLTFYDGRTLSKGAVQELELGEIRPELSRDVEIFSEIASGFLLDAHDLKLTQADGENGEVTFVK